MVLPIDISKSESTKKSFRLHKVDFLEDFDMPAFKKAFFEITDIPLIGYAGSKGKPMIISTGIATYEDIQLAVETYRF